MATNPYGLQDLQHALLQMLVEIDRICRQNGIAYSLFAGTMLGAVREGGFIPWDDDADLVLDKASLTELARVFDAQSEQYRFTFTDTWVARVVPRQWQGDACPFVDLFHYEIAPDSAPKRRLKALLLKLLQGMLKENIDYAHYGLGGKLLVFISHVLGLPFQKQTKLRWYRRLGAAMAGGGEWLHVPDDCFSGLNCVYPASCAQSFTDISFEGHTFRVSAECKAMLQTKYGADYMTPPPPNMRKPTHRMGV